MAATGTPTPNIGLRIPIGTDPASVDDINYNSNLLDTKLGAVGSDSVQDQIDTLNGNITTITYNVLNPLNGYFTKRDAFRAKIKGGVVVVESYINITTEIPTNTEFASIETTGKNGSYIAINTSTRAVYFVSFRYTGRFASETAIPTGYYYFVGCAI